MATTDQAQALLSIIIGYTSNCCFFAVTAFVIYDWLLCLDKEVKLIWNWHCRGLSFLVYVFTRYAFIIQLVLSLMTLIPMSDLGCRVNMWVQGVIYILGTVAISTFSALRAYALSNRSVWLSVVIVFLALPPAVMLIVKTIYEYSTYTFSSSVSFALAVSIPAITRASQILAEMLVVSITWWYTYQSYNIRRSVKFGRTTSSLLFYNGTMYFLFLATLYILDVILGIPLLPIAVQEIAINLDLFIDPITSILVCRFILSLREFEVNLQSATYSTGHGEHASQVSTVLQFGAQPSTSLPSIIASFAHPIHVDPSLLEDIIDEECGDDEGLKQREMDVEVIIVDAPSVYRISSDPDHLLE